MRERLWRWLCLHEGVIGMSAYSYVRPRYQMVDLLSGERVALKSGGWVRSTYNRRCIDCGKTVWQVPA